MLYPDITYKIRAAVFDIYNNIPGTWPEETYEYILCDALIKKGLHVERQNEYAVYYKDNIVGKYRTDLIVEGRIVLELKVVSDILSLHQAQILSYLKVTGLQLGMLINFGGAELYIQAFPNALSGKKALVSNFNINKIKLPDSDKKIISPFLNISNEILQTLGPGFFHQVYRRAFWDELQYHNIKFTWIKNLELYYQGVYYGSKEIKFYKVSDLLISIVAVNELNDLIVKRFSKYVKYYRCKKGIIFNFNNIVVDFRYIR